MDIRNLQLKLKKNEPSSLYLIAGDDLYLKTKAEVIIKSFFEQEGESDLETYTAPQMDYDKCLDALQTLSFFSSTKVIHVRDADKAPVKFLEDLAVFFSDGNLSGLVVILSFSKIDKRKKSLKTLISKGELVEVKTPYENQVEQWVKYIAQQEKLSLDAEAVSFLNFLVGPSLVEVSKAVEKLKDVFGKEKIGRAQVGELIAKSGEQDIFKICDMLGKGQISQANLAIEGILKSGSSAIGALSLFHRHFSILEGILASQTGGKRLGQKELAAKVGVPPYFLANYAGQSRAWSLKKTSEVFRALEAADVSLKSTKMKERAVFAGFFMEVSRILSERPGLRSLTGSLF